MEIINIKDPAAILATLKQTQPFAVSGMATIKHLNVRKEGPDDEKILALDVKLEIKGIDRRLCAYFDADDALESFLWRGNTDALIVRNGFLQPVQYANCISDADVTLGVEQFRSCEVKKFAIEPRDGGVLTLICTVSLFPIPTEISDIAKRLQDEVRIDIKGPPDLFAGASL